MKYSWGVDGHGRQHITIKNSNLIILCVIDNIWACIDILDNQK